MRAGGFGVVGLDYPAMLAVAERLGIDVDRLILAQIRLLEAKTVDQINKSAEDK